MDQSAERRKWATPAMVALVTASYVATAISLPLEMHWPIIDEPIFASSAFRFAETGELVISNLSAPTAVFESLWGGLFVAVFGASMEALRMSTVILTAISAPFLFKLVSDFGAHRLVAVSAVAAYLFCPLAYALSVTFHTDAHALALIVISAALFIRGMNSHSLRVWLLLGGGVVAAISFLSRPQSLAIVAAALLALWTRKGEWPRLRASSAVVLPSLVVIALHGVWVVEVGEPFLREASRASLTSREMGDIVRLGVQTALMTPIYLGLFLLPVVPLVFKSFKSVKSWLGTRLGFLLSGILAAAWGALLVRGWGPFQDQTWITHSGLGGVDRALLGGRPHLLPPEAWVAVTVVLLTVALIFASMTSGARDTARGREAHLFVTLSLGGTLATALISALALQPLPFDRYFLPALPFALALGLRHAPPRTHRFAISGVALVGVAALSFFGMADAFSTYEQSGEFAIELTQSRSVLPGALDAGAAWAAVNFVLNEDKPDLAVDQGRPFWARFYPTSALPDYAITLSPLRGTIILEQREVDSLLHTEPTLLYFLSRGDRRNLYSDWREY